MTPVQKQALQSSIETWSAIEKVHFELYTGGSEDFAKRHLRLSQQAQMVVAALRLYKAEIMR